MLKFFRKIRQQLIGEGQVKKYLFYAIGEILLVVLGILIALQINNWNEQNKNRQAENKALTDLYYEFEKSFERFQDMDNRISDLRGNMVNDLAYQNLVIGLIDDLWAQLTVGHEMKQNYEQIMLLLTEELAARKIKIEKE